jgi:Dynein heavy chain, N-terminal region 2
MHHIDIVTTAIVCIGMCLKVYYVLCNYSLMATTDPAFANVTTNYTTLHYTTLHYTTVQDSIPLIVNLKNDAMKPRHWAKLMEATGVKFDAASFKSLTLANIFAMELHKYSSDVDEIVNAAVQEQKIETEVSVTTDHP